MYKNLKPRTKKYIIHWDILFYDPDERAEQEAEAKWESERSEFEFEEEEEEEEDD